MAKRKKVETRTHRPLGGGIITVKGRPGLFGQLRIGEKRLQAPLVDDAADRDGAELALAKWTLEKRRESAEPALLADFSAWLLDYATTSPRAAEFRALAAEVLDTAEPLPNATTGLRNVTAKAFVTEFLRTKKGNVGAAHYADLQSRCERFAEFAGDRAMSAIDAVVVADYFAKLADSEGHPVKVPVLAKNGKPVVDDDGKPVEKVVRDKLSPHAIRRHRSALSLLWKCAIDRKAVVANVWTGNAAKIARGQEYVAVNLTDEEVARVLALVAEPVRPILVFCAETGLRLGEARALTWQQVAAEFGEFTIARAKSGRSRTLPTTAKAKEILEARWGTHVAKTRGADLVFDDYSRSRIYVCFKDAVKKSGVDRRTRVHDLRHHVGTALANENVPIHVVMQALGHSRLQTVQRYVHSGADDLRKAFAKMEQAKAPAAPATAASG